MQDDVTWKLSLLMDDELPPEEAIALLEQVEQDPQLQLKWFQYQLIRHALRNGDGIPSHPQFLEQVRMALAREPDPQPVAVPESPPQRFSLNRWIVVPAALAAAAVMVVLVWEGQNASAPKPPPVAQAPSSQTHRIGEAAFGERGTAAGPHRFSQIEDYLLAHSEDSLYLPGSQHMLSYARIVTHGGR